MILKCQTGDTIQGKKYKIEGIQAQNYQKEQERKREQKILSRSEMKPVLVKKATFRDKLKGKRDVYKRQPQVIGMSGKDPVAFFIVENVALGKGLLVLGKALKPKLLASPKTLVGMDGQTYVVDKSVSEAALDQYLTDTMIMSPETRVVPAMKTILLVNLRYGVILVDKKKAEQLARLFYFTLYSFNVSCQ